ncbi:2-polyprenyl-6-methoxyphenol hydroxylase-like oxidoreductase [Mycobacterium sp. JS623]|uniref:FAD-dependent monooxygenase n=1 Tax=Mycobacterium sp. JS623 TaxID=212767 RepID=UPI0002A591BB|nr:FAD-dependent monooxygenase [Mycobacterium sp. JS623]AGB23072.1 2-polyprenyl-6-methoxyphenol hydroxylase-like oxidoreductase [Mycobacterium sp. JS623]
MPTAQTALVIGGGIAGPVAATALEMAGIEAAVYEARPADPASANGIGGSLALEPNGLAALGIVGAADAVRAAASPITCSMMSIGGSPARELPGRNDLPPRRLIDRGALHRILREQAEQTGVRIHDDKKLIRVDEHPDGVTAHFADGTSARADVLIGADGVHSTVRRLIDPEAPTARYLNLLGFEGLVDDASDTAALEPGTMTFAFGKRAYYLYWKRPDGRIGWGANLPSQQYLTLKQARAISAEDWLHTLRSTYANDVPGARLAAETTSETLQAVGGLHIMPAVPHWHRDRMVLVGDAVHAPSNSTGQGASLAMESAIQLARCLRDMPDVASAFVAYERLRRARVEKIAARGARISHAKAPGPIAQRMMRLVLPVMFATMNVEKTMATEQRYTIDWDAPVQEDTKALA